MSEQLRGNENLSHGIYEGVGKYDVPEILPVYACSAQKFIPFNYAATEKVRQNKGVHFFIDDY